jgi:hypothetical protein
MRPFVIPHPMPVETPVTTTLFMNHFQRIEMLVPSDYMLFGNKKCPENLGAFFAINPGVGW